MHLYKTMQNFLVDQNYYIDIYDKYFHIYNYIDILKLNEDIVLLQMDNFKLEFKGNDFKVKQLEKREILVYGKLENVRFY